MRRLTDEQIHELARDMAIHLVQAVVDLNRFAIDAIYTDAGDDESWDLREARSVAKPYAAALSEFSPFLSHLCSAACAYGYEGTKR